MFRQLLILPALFLAGTAHAQYTPGPSTLSFDTSNMKVAVSMDRAVYLPGEAAEITLEVSNPGAAAVLTLKPFTAATGCIYVSWKVGDEFQYPPLDLCKPYVVDSTTTTTFAAGQSEQRMYRSYDNLLDLGTSFMSSRAVPGNAGIYRLNYRYGSSTASAEFTVVAPKLEASAFARVRDEPLRESPAREQPLMLKKYVYVLALRADEVTYICVAQAPAQQTNLRFRNIDGTFSSLGATPMKRIATSAAPIVGLSVTADPDENLAIEWTDAAGRRQTQEYRDGYPAWRSRAREH
jgi:hypothetical protein